MSDCLVVLNPRSIEECVASYRALDIDIGWLTGFAEPQLEEAFYRLPPVYDRYIVTSDDTIVSQNALDAVTTLLDEGHPVVTGYCPLDCKSPLVNLIKRPLSSPVPSVVSYEFWRRIDVQTWRHKEVPTFFTGMCLTGMSKEMWSRFPMTVSPLGLQTDYSLSYRLQEARIPIVAAREGLVDHVKERWNHPDQEPRKRLLIGEIESRVWVEKKEPALV